MLSQRGSENSPLLIDIINRGLTLVRLIILLQEVMIMQLHYYLLVAQSKKNIVIEAQFVWALKI